MQGALRDIASADVTSAVAEARDRCTAECQKRGPAARRERDGLVRACRARRAHAPAVTMEWSYATCGKTYPAGIDAPSLSVCCDQPTGRSCFQEHLYGPGPHGQDEIQAALDECCCAVREEGS
jgi:hypothetical protein